MRRLLGLIFNRYVLIVVGVVAAAIVIWWVGPTISISNFYPFESELVRWIQIGILALTPVVRFIWRLVKARRANATLMSGLLGGTEAKADARVDPAAGEVAQLRQRFEGALGLLRKRHFGSERPSLWTRIRSLGSQQYLYDLPWYVFIGAPGAGKTTALVNSGLRFPLEGRLGREAVRGVGGTRDCDWWFTDGAVFLDTAGRYTTQQSHQDVDAGAWKGFLTLLKKARPRRPINGVLLTISVADLLQQSPVEREAHTQALRARVRELYEELGVRLPIYVLVTKTDLLAGFTEFFGSLGKEERAQVWGFTLPIGDGGVEAGTLSTELQQLEQRLYERLPDRLEEEREPGRRALLYGFPQQFALLRDRLADFVETTFARSTFESAALLRGVYFTSGTQEGSPIDRVMGALAREMGLERKLLAAQHPSGRSYFLTTLLREVVFPEAGLAGLDMKGERRRRLIQVGAMGASAAVLVLAAAAWWISYLHNKEYLSEVKTDLQDVKKQVRDLQPTSDLSALLPALSSVRTLSEARGRTDGSVPWSWRFGLYQGGKLQAASRAAYQRMLQDTYLPSLTTYLEQRLGREADTGLEESFGALKAYVMLYDAKHFSRDAVWRWYEAHIAELFPGAGAEEQKALKLHFEMLYEKGWVNPTIARDDALVTRARAAISREALPKRIYDRLKREPVSDIRDFTVAEKAGPKALGVFERRSREPLTKGVPGFFTKDGYYKYFARNLETVTVQMADEASWVLGTGTRAIAAATESPALVEAVKRLYLEDYRNTWRQFIDDVGIVKGRDLTRNSEIALILSGVDSPLKPLVKAFDRETSLSVPPEGEAGLVGSVTGKAQEYAGKAKKMITGGAGDPLVKSMVDSQFDDVHRLAGTGTGPAPIDATIQQLSDFYRYLVAAKVQLDAAQAPPPADSANTLRAEAARLPEPLRSMLQNLVESSSREITDRVRFKQEADKRQEAAEQAKREADIRRMQQEKEGEDKKLKQTMDATDKKRVAEKAVQDEKLANDKALQIRKQIDLELQSQVAEYCKTAINGRYPFVRSSKEDVTLVDFSRLFSPGGVLDGFFQKYLAPHVETSQMPWRFSNSVMGTSRALAEFQRAQVIRDIFFQAGGKTPSIQLEFKPLEMDATIKQFSLDVDGKVVRYAHGPQVTVPVQFPGPSGRSQVRISIVPPPPSGVGGMKFDGPWALFRMFDEVKIEETRQYERFIAPIDIGGRKAVFEVLATSVRNPFRLPELTQFHCPVAL